MGIAPRLAAFVLLVLVILGANGCGERRQARLRVEAELARTAAAATQAQDAERVGFPVEIEAELGMRFRLLPTGSFRMGSEAGAPGHREDETPHEVHFITPSYLQVTEVTNAQYRRFRPDHDSGTTPEGVSLDGDEQPVVNVTHDDALAYAAWLRERDPHWLYRLPTEAEWEWACRTGDLVEGTAGERSAALRAWVTPRSGARPAARDVGRGEVDPWGFTDLHGNVAEWCHDRYGVYPAWKQDNPQGATFGDEFVARGASWREGVEGTRCARRQHHPAGFKAPDLGFRLAMALGYARHEYGRYEVTFRTVDPTVADAEEAARPGYALRMISVVDRLTDRQNRPAQRPIWTDIPGLSPRTVHLAPGRYYVYAHREDGDRTVRGLEVKFDIPDRRDIPVPVPREDQAAPQ